MVAVAVGAADDDGAAVAAADADAPALAAAGVGSDAPAGVPEVFAGEAGEYSKGDRPAVPFWMACGTVTGAGAT